jgi:hypothetical protein
MDMFEMYKFWWDFAIPGLTPAGVTFRYRSFALAQRMRRVQNTHFTYNRRLA